MLPPPGHSGVATSNAKLEGIRAKSWYSSADLWKLYIYNPQSKRYVFKLICGSISGYVIIMWLSWRVYVLKADIHLQISGSYIFITQSQKVSNILS